MNETNPSMSTEEDHRAEGEEATVEDVEVKDDTKGEAAEGEEEKKEGEEKKEDEEEEEWGEDDPRHIEKALRQYVLELVDVVNKKRAGEAKNMDVTKLPGVVLDLMRVAKNFSQLKGKEKKRVVVVAALRVLADAGPEESRKIASIAGEVVESLFEVEQSSITGVANFVVASAAKRGCCVIS